MGTMIPRFTDRSPEVPLQDPNANNRTSFASTSHDKKAMAMDIIIVSSQVDYKTTLGTNTGFISLHHDDNSVPGHLMKPYPMS